MLPVHSHTQKRSFSKVEATLWQRIPTSGRIFLTLCLYLACIIISFLLVLRWNVKVDPNLSELALWNPNVKSKFRIPQASHLKNFESLGEVIPGENVIIKNSKYIQHMFLEQLRKYRELNPNVYAWDSSLKEILPDGWQGHKIPKGVQDSGNKISFPITKLHNPTRETLNEYIRRSIPVILTGVVDKWKAYQSWTDEYLISKVGDVKIPIEYSKGSSFYGDEKRQKLSKLTVREFLKLYRDPNRDRNYYLAETSILKHFKPLLEDFPSNLDFIPQHWKLSVIQLWIGAGGQITPSHNDESENILCQFRGSRTFYLHDPFQVDLLYTTPENPVYPSVKVREGKSNFNKYPLFAKSMSPTTLFLNEGECLYLPALFYHRVESTPNLRSLAINYWYNPQSTISEVIWMAISGHEWRKEGEMLKSNRKREDV